MSGKKETEIPITNHENTEAEEPKKQGKQVESEEETASRADARDETEETAEPIEPAQPLTEEERLAARVAELEDKLLRTAADFDNYKKRMARNYEEMMRSATDSILHEFLDIVDNFERALQHATEDSGDGAFRQGARLILNQMKELLRKHNVEPIEAVGQPFNPDLHEALMQVDSDEYEEGVVAVEINKGYRQGNRVLRHAKVGVSKGKSDRDNSDQDDNNEQ